MAKEVKKLAVKEYRERYQGIKNCLFIDYRGLNARQSVQLRNWLKSEEIQINILKNSVAQLAFKEIGFPDVNQFIAGPVAFIYSKPGGKGDDPVTLSKRVTAWQTKHKLLKVQGGYAEGRAVSASEVKELSRLPSRQGLITYCAQLFNRPLTQLAWGLQSIILRPVRSLRALLERLAKEQQ